jgi:very-short-patch-repair endonuclease
MPVYDLERQDRIKRRADHNRGFARSLRRQTTPYERLLWRRLCAKQMMGHRFRRQHPIGRYIVDFVCLERKLVIELDGEHHSGPEGRDAVRDEWLYRSGFTVLRFGNAQLKREFESVLETIAAHLHPPPYPSPSRGEGSDG